LNNKETGDKQDKIIELLGEILVWTRLQGVQNARAVLDSALTTNVHKIAYQLSDGRSSAEVAKDCGVSGMTITNYWKRWFTLGIARPSPKFKGRFERIFSLEDLGIEIPTTEIGAKAKAKKEPEPEELASKEGDAA